MMKVHNDKPCPTKTTFDFQLPITSLLSEMILTEKNSNCTFVGEFLPEQKAQATFDTAVKVADIWEFTLDVQYMQVYADASRRTSKSPMHTSMLSSPRITLHPDWKFCCIDKILHPRESDVEPFRSRQRGIHPQNRVYRGVAQGRWTGSNFNSKDASATAHFSGECVHNCCCQVSFQLPINFASWKVHGDIKANINVREPSGVKDLKCSAPVTG